MDARLWGYLQRILTARVYDVAVETPLERAEKLSARLGTPVWLKREDTQPVFSFKLRGAYNKMARLPADRLARGVVCASAGNHAQGVALAARRLGCRASPSQGVGEVLHHVAGHVEPRAIVAEAARRR